MAQLKQTPLFETHKKLGGKIIEFSGWQMPVQYTSIIKEHINARTNASLFDVSHMGEFIITGPDALKFLQNVCTNDLAKIKPGQAQYTAICNHEGGVVDDCINFMYKDKYMMVVNAGTQDKDWGWLKECTDGMDVDLQNVGEHTAKIDIQGPKSKLILQKITDADLSILKRLHFIESKVGGIKTTVSRSGYTAEDGFELFFQEEHAETLWELLLSSGLADGLKPAGLGARDTLRLEAGYSLYGHELTENITPIEADLAWTVKDSEFIGSDIVLQQKKNGAKRKIVAFEMVGRAIPRQHHNILLANKEIGEVTSGTYSPTFQKPIGLALIGAEHSAIGTKFTINIRDKNFEAQIVKKPIYSYAGGK